MSWQDYERGERDRAIEALGLGEVLSATQTWDPAATAATQGAEATVNVPVAGAAVGDPVLVSHDQFDTEVDAQLIGQVDQAGRVLVRLVNTKALAVNLPSGTLKVLVFKT